MKTIGRAFVGEWRITEMEAWDAEYLDMEVPAHITIRKDLTGDFQFGLVQGEMDGRVEVLDGAARFDFSWEGSDENDPMSGRGWLRIEGDDAEGRIFIHGGDESGLKAVRQ